QVAAGVQLRLVARGELGRRAPVLAGVFLVDVGVRVGGDPQRRGGRALVGGAGHHRGDTGAEGERDGGPDEPGGARTAPPGGSGRRDLPTVLRTSVPATRCGPPVARAVTH